MELVQVRNPRTGNYILIDKATGMIVEHKETSGTYDDIPVVTTLRN